MAKLGTAYVDIKGDWDAFSREADNAGNGMAGMFSEFGSKAGLLMVGGITAALAGAVAGGKFLLDLGGDIDNAFDTIRIGTGATGDALEGLQDDFRAVASTTPSDLGSVGTAVSDLNRRLGLTGEPLQQMSKQMLDLSRITGTDLAANIENSTRLFGDWGIPVTEQSATLDQLYKATQASGIGLDDLTQTAIQFGEPLRQLGYDFDDALGLVSKFEKEGVNTETVFAGMKMALGNLAKDGKDPATSFRDLVEQIKNAGTAAEANAIGLELFGTRAGPDLIGSIRGGKFEIDEMTAAIAGGGDTISKASADTADWKEKWQVLKNQIFLKMEPLAVKVFDGVGKIFTNLGPWMQKANAIVTPIMQQIVAWVSANWPKISTTIQNVMTSVQSIIQNVMLTVKTLWDKYGDLIMERVQIAFNFIVNTISAVMKTVQGIIQVVTGLITGDWSKVWDGIKNVFIGVWDGIRGAVTAAVGFVRTTIEAVGRTISSIWDGIWNGIKNTASGALDAVVQFVIDLPGKIADTLGGVLLAGLGLGKSFLDGIISGISGAVDFVTDIANKIWNAVVGFWNDKIIEPVSNWTVDTHIPGVGKVTPFGAIDGLKLPTLEQGGVVDKTTLALIGESQKARPEIVAPAPMLRDIFASELAKQAGRGNGGGTYQLNVQTVRSDVDIAEQFRRMERLAGVR